MTIRNNLWVFFVSLENYFVLINKLNARNFARWDYNVVISTLCVCAMGIAWKKKFHWKSFHEISMIYWCWLEANFEEHSVEKQEITFNEDTYYVFDFISSKKTSVY